MAANAREALLAAIRRRGDGCSPAIHELCAETGLHRRTVLHLCTVLEASGALLIEHHGGRRSRYRIQGVATSLIPAVATRGHPWPPPTPSVVRTQRERSQNAGLFDTLSDEERSLSKRDSVSSSSSRQFQASGVSTLDGPSLFAKASICDPAEEAIAIYNQAAEHVGWTRARRLTERRRRRLLEALKECSGLTGFRAFIAKAAASGFLRGERGRKPGSTWLPDLDWLLQPDHLLQVIEGRYDDRSLKPDFKRIVEEIRRDRSRTPGRDD